MLSIFRSATRGAAIHAALAAILCLPASALESAWVDAGNAKVRLVAAAGVNGAPIRAGIEIRMMPGWYTYWRYPGDAGIPPQFDWSASANLDSVSMRYPAPQRIAVGGGLNSLGYYDAVVFPITVRAANPAQPVKLQLAVSFGVCEKICIPADAHVRLEIPPGTDAKSPLLDAADARVPRKTPLGERPGLAVLAVNLERGKEPHALIDVAVPPGRDFDLFAEGPTEDWSLALPERIEATGGRARFVLPIDGAPPRAGPIPSKIRLTLVAGDEAIEVDAPLD
jgi:DsbC/DsbD-like thiol-disulfide interchange protein